MRQAQTAQYHPSLNIFQSTVTELTQVNNAARRNDFPLASFGVDGPSPKHTLS